MEEITIQFNYLNLKRIESHNFYSSNINDPDKIFDYKCCEQCKDHVLVDVLLRYVECNSDRMLNGSSYYQDNGTGKNWCAFGPRIKYGSSNLTDSDAIIKNKEVVKK